MKRILDSLSRADMRRNPILAISKRFWWKVRWPLLGDRLFTTRLFDGTRIVGPKTGTLALIYYQGMSEPETMAMWQRFLKPSAVVFDVGAHIGEYAIVAARQIGSQGRVYAFEPQPDLAKVIEQNRNFLNLENIFVNNLALGDTVGEISFTVPKEKTMASLAITDNDQQTYIVQMTTLDAFCAENDLTHVDLIKMDIEGAELMALKGASQLLRNPNGPVLIFEYSPRTYGRFGYDLRDVQEFLEQLQYHVYTFDALGNFSLLDVDKFEKHKCNLIATKTPLN